MTEVLDHVTPLSPPPRGRRRSQQIVTSFEAQPEEEQRPSALAVPQAPLSPESPSPVSLTPSISMFDDREASDSDRDHDDDDYLPEEDSLSADEDDVEPIGDALDQVLTRRGKIAMAETNFVDPSNAFSKPQGSVVSLGHANL